jgi:cyclase
MEGADELVFLDISATHEKRKTLSALARRIAHHINIPFTVGGGISSVEDVSILLENGADKISINTAAYKNPKLIEELSSVFGSQCVVLAIDAKKETDGKYYVYLNGGRVATVTNCLDWAKQGVELGAGEILLTSMDHDGTRNGFAVELTCLLADSLSVPVIASGGGGNMAHFSEIFEAGKADAALAASVFHFGEIPIPILKKYLNDEGISIRI